MRQVPSSVRRCSDLEIAAPSGWAGRLAHAASAINDVQRPFLDIERGLFHGFAQSRVRMTGAPDIFGAASGFSDGNGLRNQSADGVLQDVRCDAGTSAMAYVIHVWYWLALRPRQVTWQTGSQMSIGGFFRAKLPAPSAAVSPALAPIPAMCAAKFSIASQPWIEKAYFSFATRRVRPRFRFRKPDIV